MQYLVYRDNPTQDKEKKRYCETHTHTKEEEENAQRKTGGTDERCGQERYAEEITEEE